MKCQQTSNCKLYYNTFKDSKWFYLYTKSGLTPPRNFRIDGCIVPKQLGWIKENLTQRPVYRWCTAWESTILKYYDWMAFNEIT